MGIFQEIEPIKEWFKDACKGPFIISGPCSAESEEQVLDTAHKLKDVEGVSVFRAGIWKPRTRPETFEGIGEEGLQWLQKVKKETDLLVTTEVANPEHVEKCLKAGIDILWIGARTTANPFSVQSIADALKGVDIPVMIKNPTNPDINLWIGALERVAKAGITKIAAIHRGFFPFEETELRNIPKWEIPIELKRTFNNLPIICDPSHIAGNTTHIQDISQRALDLNLDGLMIESHINPTVALSDAQQQLTPDKLQQILNNLVYRNPNFDNKDLLDKLEQYRSQIDSIDSQMLELLTQRMKITEDIGEYKHEKNIAVFQLKRWEYIFRTRNELGKKLGLSKDFIKRLLQLIHKESIQKQIDIMRERNGKVKN
jgi:chorismate mutase